jgi:hypothetical protein
MKSARSIDKAIDPEEPIQGITISAQKENNLPGESDLSPERIVNGAATTTALLAQILAQQQQHHQFRDWGINE